MAGVEVGPNDIVIHLVNPYKCGDCGEEFTSRPSFLEHLAEHMGLLKAEKPCHQIMCMTSIVEQPLKGIAVTRDILQMNNDDQMFELLDPTIDYTQHSPLKTLEQAGILKLPPHRPSQPSMPMFVSTQSGVDMIRMPERTGLSDKRQVSLLRQTPQSHLHPQPGRFKELAKELLGDGQLVTISDSGVVEYVPAVLDSIVQQAILDSGQVVKLEDGGVMRLDIPSVAAATDHDGRQGSGVLPTRDIVEQPEVEQEKFITGAKKRALIREDNATSTNCPICGVQFSTVKHLELHQAEAHSDQRIFNCEICSKSFRDVSFLRKHRETHQKKHVCPVCHKMFVLRSQLTIHMRHHDKKRFIQFGSNYHEVRVVSSRNSKEQIVQEHFMLMLLSKEEQAQIDEKNRMVLEKRDETRDVESLGKPINSTVCSQGTDYFVKERGPEESDTVSININGDFESAMDTSGPLANINSGQSNESHDRGNAGSLESNAREVQVEDEIKKKIVFKCGHCKKMIGTRPALWRHLIKHTSTKPFQCDKCLKGFTDKVDLLHHHKTHTKPIKCHLCQQNFSKSKYLQSHLEKGCPSTSVDDRIEVLDESRYKCSVCGKVLKSKSNALRHLRIHDFEGLENGDGDTKKMACVVNLPGASQRLEDYYEPLPGCVGCRCLICGVRQRYKSLMFIHIRRHLGQRPFQCSQCHKSFFARHILRKHEQNHTRPYKCPVCGKAFIRRYMMTSHFNKRHNLAPGEEDPMEDITELPEEKLIQCDICGKTMKQSHKSIMLQHIRLHKDKRPYSCSVCNKSFSSETTLKKHSQTHSRPYVCQVCGASFSRRYLLTDHFRKACIYHVSNRTCDENEEAYSADLEPGLQKKENDGDASGWQIYHYNILQGNEHLETNLKNYFCDPCDKKFTNYDTFIRHIRTFSKPTTCKYCRRGFENKHSAVIHQRCCLGVSFLPEKLSKSKSLHLTDWQERVKIMEEVNKTIQTVDVEPQSDFHTPGVATDVLQKTKDALKCKAGKYRCPQCDRNFCTPRGLKIHASVHVRLFKCDVCDVEFKTIGGLRSHNKTHDAPNNSLTSEATENYTLENPHTEDVHAMEASLVENVAANCGDSTTDEPDPLKNNVGSVVEKRASKPQLDDSEIEQNTKDNEREQDSEENMTVDSSKEHEGGGPTMENKTEESSKNNEDINHSKKNKIESSSEIDARTDRKKLVTPQTNHHDSSDLKLLQSGTRGRPYRCHLCRKRFTEKAGLDAHHVKAH